MTAYAIDLGTALSLSSSDMIEIVGGGIAVRNGIDLKHSSRFGGSLD